MRADAIQPSGRHLPGTPGPNPKSPSGTARRADAADVDTWRALGRPIDAQDPRVRRDAAGKLLSELFFKPLLAEMRKSPLGAPLARGGRGEEVFGEQLDQRVADAVASASTGLAARFERYLDPERADALRESLTQQRALWDVDLRARGGSSPSGEDAVTAVPAKGWAV